MKFMCFALIFLIFALKGGLAIWCYRCTSANPQCGDDFYLRGIGSLGEKCPEKEDICVKVTERRGDQRTIIRDCLSSLGFRNDIPADKNEGCRKGVKDMHLAKYVNHTLMHELKRDYFYDVEFCVCFVGDRCNGAESQQKSSTILGIGVLSMVLLSFKNILFRF